MNVSESQADADSSTVDQVTRRIYRLVVDGIEGIGGIEIASGIVETAYVASDAVGTGTRLGLRRPR